MEIQQFINDIFAVSDLSKVEDLDKVINFEKSCLDYNALFAHPRFKSVITFTIIFKHTFGFYPSHPFVEEMLDGINVWDMHTVTQRLIKSTFLAVIARQESSPLLAALEKAKFTATQVMHSIQSSPQTAKLLAWNWLSRCDTQHSNDTATLFTSFKTLQRTNTVMSVNTSKYTNDILDWGDIIKACPYEYDADAYHITSNNNYFRNIYMHYAIYFDTNISPTHAVSLTKAVASVLEKERLVVCGQPGVLDALSNNVGLNMTFVPPQFMPHNCAATCFAISDNPVFDLKLGNTLIKKILIVTDTHKSDAVETVDTVETVETVAIATQDVSVSASFINRLMVNKKTALPLFAPQPVLDAYFKIYFDLSKVTKEAADITASRAAVYTSLIPSLARLSFPLADVDQNSKKYALVLIDTRANNLSLTSIYAALANIKRNEYDIVIGTRKANQDFYRAHLPPNSTKFFWHPCFESTPFDIEAYNTFAKSHHLWEYLHVLEYKKCVIIQDDGLIARPGIEAWLENPAYTYVGAPWMPCPGNEELGPLTNKRMVGNGGMCIRDVATMYNISKSHTQGARTLFNNRLQQIQEDVFYAKYSDTPNLHEASNFAVEQVFNPNAIAFHKPWAYLPFTRILELCAPVGGR